MRHMKGLGAHPIGTETTATKYVRFSNIYMTNFDHLKPKKGKEYMYV